jgi:hypothetical protein
MSSFTHPIAMSAPFARSVAIASQGYYGAPPPPVYYGSPPAYYYAPPPPVYYGY